MAHELSGKRIAILSAMGVEKVELAEPKKALEKAGATVHVLSPDGKAIKTLEFPEWGDTLSIDGKISDANPANYDALYLPGGVVNPDLLRTEETAIQFVRQFAASGKPIASMCHGPSTLITAGLVEGKRMTSWPSISTDLKNAGADWVDQEVVVDGNLITSRNSKDIPALNREMIKLFSQQSSASK